MKKNIKYLAFILLGIVVFSFKTAVTNADDIIGIWEPSNGRSRIKIEKIGTKYYGKIVWLKDPNDAVSKKPKVDKNNPDTSMRNVPLKGYRILKDFTYNTDNKDEKEWHKGTIYDPENGSTYSCNIKMKKENTLDIRGYIGVKALGRTDTWKKVTLK